MTELTLERALKIVEATIATGTRKGLKPLAAAVFDARGALKAFAAQDGTSLRRGEIAKGKAEGALALGVGSRAIGKMATERPHFVAAASHAVGGSLIPVPGGVLIRQGGILVGASGVSGDTSDNDEICALAGIGAAGLEAEPG